VSEQEREHDRPTEQPEGTDERPAAAPPEPEPTRGVRWGRYTGVSVGVVVLIVGLRIGLRVLVHEAVQPEPEQDVAERYEHAMNDLLEAQRNMLPVEQDTPREIDGTPVALTRGRVEQDWSAPGGRLDGFVRSSATGEPVADAELVFVHGATTSSARTGADGAFSFTPSVAGDEELALVAASGFVPHLPARTGMRTTYHPRAREVLSGPVITLTPATTVEALGETERADAIGVARMATARATRLWGTVRDSATAAPIPAFTVIVWHEAEGRRESLARATVLDGGGRFALGGVAAGSVWVTVVADGYRSRDDAHAALIEGEPRIVDVRLDPGGASVNGRVTDEGTGRPIAGAEVTVVGPAAASTSGLRVARHGRADASGQFAVAGLDDGTCRVPAVAPGHPASHVDVVVSGGRSPPVAVPLRAP